MGQPSTYQFTANDTNVPESVGKSIWHSGDVLSITCRNASTLLNPLVYMYTVVTVESTHKKHQCTLFTQRPFNIVYVLLTLSCIDSSLVLGNTRQCLLLK